MKSGTNLIRSELELAKEEVKDTARRLENHALQMVLFGGLLLLAALPFVAFLVIGLGELLEGRYWLSALIVAAAFALIGGIFGYRAFRKFENQDLSLARTRESLSNDQQLVRTKIQAMGAAIKGNNYEYGK